ncbi:MAG: hypothetical protein KDI92_13105 [Xanthomonadales bacterium]|nr:hypothetical protein [Xanthomonadales bacterium]
MANIPWLESGDSFWLVAIGLCTVNLGQKLFNLPKEQLLGIYIQFIAAYKILITVFVLAPYLVIRFIL